MGKKLRGFWTTDTMSEINFRNAQGIPTRARGLYPSRWKSWIFGRFMQKFWLCVRMLEIDETVFNVIFGLRDVYLSSFKFIIL